MREFSVAGFVEHTVALIHATDDMQHHLLEVACEAVVKEAKSELGHYQPTEGPFPAWAPLTPATIDRKGGMDEPLIREGDLKESIKYNIDGNVGVVGSDDPAAIYQELGTRKMPPRSFLGHAAHHLARPIVTMVGTQYAMFLAGESVYNLEADILGGDLAGHMEWHKAGGRSPRVQTPGTHIMTPI